MKYVILSLFYFRFVSSESTLSKLPYASNMKIYSSPPFFSLFRSSLCLPLPFSTLLYFYLQIRSAIITPCSSSLTPP